MKDPAWEEFLDRLSSTSITVSNKKLTDLLSPKFNIDKITVSTALCLHSTCVFARFFFLFFRIKVVQSGGAVVKKEKCYTIQQNVVMV
jgi:hypothetical protein